MDFINDQIRVDLGLPPADGRHDDGVLRLITVALSSVAERRDLSPERMWSIARSETAAINNFATEGDDFGFCVCGFEIKNHSRMKNFVTGREFDAGCECVKKFWDIDLNPVFEALKRLRKNMAAFPGEALIESEMTRSTGGMEKRAAAISRDEADWLLSTRGRRDMTLEGLMVRAALNLRLYRSETGTDQSQKGGEGWLRLEAQRYLDEKAEAAESRITVKEADRVAKRAAEIADAERHAKERFEEVRMRLNSGEERHVVFAGMSLDERCAIAIALEREPKVHDEKAAPKPSRQRVNPGARGVTAAAFFHTTKR